METQCEKCGRTSNIVNMQQCPFCRPTPHIQGIEEWKTKYLQALRTLHHASISGDDVAIYEKHVEDIENELLTLPTKDSV